MPLMKRVGGGVQKRTNNSNLRKYLTNYGVFLSRKQILGTEFRALKWYFWYFNHNDIYSICTLLFKYYLNNNYIMAITLFR